MAKLLKAARILLVLMMLLYCGLVLEQFAVKILDPGNEGLRYWKPGGEVGIVAVAFVALLGILACSTGLEKCVLAVVIYPARSMARLLHLGWVVRRGSAVQDP